MSKHPYFEQYKQLLKLSEIRGDKPDIAKYAFELGEMSLFENSYKEAERYYQISHANLTGLDAHEKKFVEEALNIEDLGEKLGDLSSRLGNISEKDDEQREYYSQGYRYYEDCLFPGKKLTSVAKARILYKMGGLAEVLDWQSDALGSYQASLDLYQENGDQSSALNILQKLPAILIRLGQAARLQKDYSQAHHYYQQGFEILEYIGMQVESESSNCLLNTLKQKSLEQLGDLALKNHQYDQAQSYYKQSLVLSKQLNRHGSSLGILSHLAEIALKQDNSSNADLYLQQAQEFSSLSPSDDSEPEDNIQFDLEKLKSFDGNNVLPLYQLEITEVTLLSSVTIGYPAQFSLKICNVGHLTWHDRQALSLRYTWIRGGTTYSSSVSCHLNEPIPAGAVIEISPVEVNVPDTMQSGEGQVCFCLKIEYLKDSPKSCIPVTYEPKTKA